MLLCYTIYRRNSHSYTHSTKLLTASLSAKALYLWALKQRRLDRMAIVQAAQQAKEKKGLGYQQPITRILSQPETRQKLVGQQKELRQQSVFNNKQPTSIPLPSA